VPTTSIVGTDARISWVEPSKNGEDELTYEILVLESDGTTFSAHSECDGSSNTVIADK
jgi:hypothetical protein